MQALDCLQHREDTRQQISSNLQVFEPLRQTADDLRRAAVAVTITHHGDESALILTRRAGSLREHRGQWAMPGGRIDAGETAVQAALRELHEEINLEVDESQVLGTLDDYITRSGYNITPVVVWSEVDWEDLHPNPGEVASINPFTFSELSRTDSPILQSIPQSERQVLSMHFGDDDVIFAPTGAMLYQFREVAIRGRATRVLHFDQPVFAWK
jgi:8-oxo-dGTP pyrophosphatase MutT (NUDIX family)